jgi:pimeloyl-ACP methyl ester carboxylesterase
VNRRHLPDPSIVGWRRWHDEGRLHRMSRGAAESPINVVTWGSGEPVVCVHGSLSWGTFAFRAQRLLAQGRALLLPDRRGYGGSPATARADFEVDAGDVAALLDEPAHLVGHSYGAVVALLVAVRRPDAVQTLTLVEPATFALVRGEPAVEELIAALSEVQTATDSLPVGEFVLRYLEALGYQRAVDLPVRLRLTVKAARAARTTMTERPPWEAPIALDRLAEARRPTLLVSGRWDNLAGGERAVGCRAFGAAADALTHALAARRMVIDGWAHGCQYSGEPFNDALRSFWESARDSTRDARHRTGTGQAV